LAVKAALVSVLAANCARAAVVLVVEDETLIRFAVAERLREAGYTVVETASGEEAIAMCESDLSIDIVFTDIQLIGSASGWDVAECARADRPNVSVLYTSGKSIDHGRCIPGSAFLAKPYQYCDVVNVCDRLRIK
jgi:CheY-like chemotaxis protein